MEDFIKVSRSKFGDRFSYEHTNYTYSDIPVKLTCKLHNHTFSLKPNYHLSKSDSGGCKHCGKLLMNRWSIKSVRRLPDIEKSTGYFYLGKILGIDGLKIGVTKDLSARKSCYKTDLAKYPDSNFEYLGYLNSTYLRVFIVESALKVVFQELKNTTHNLNFGGKNEIFILTDTHLSFVYEILEGKHLSYLNQYIDHIHTNKSKHFLGLVEYFREIIERKNIEKEE